MLAQLCEPEGVADEVIRTAHASRAALLLQWTNRRSRSRSLCTLPRINRFVGRSPHTVRAASPNQLSKAMRSKAPMLVDAVQGVQILPQLPQATNSSKRSKAAANTAAQQSNAASSPAYFAGHGALAHQYARPIPVDQVGQLNQRKLQVDLIASGYRKNSHSVTGVVRSICDSSKNGGFLR